ncbi:hypothetical protein LR003_02620 [candidate division NPL-UPA2 bacterium]|nr:hypothetical protein [candidate division NPL-UPA2 bacterium]
MTSTGFEKMQILYYFDGIGSINGGDDHLLGIFLDRDNKREMAKGDIEFGRIESALDKAMKQAAKKHLRRQ